MKDGTRRSRDHDIAPEPRGRQHAPPQQQQQRKCGRDEAAAQVVEDLPLRKHRQRVGFAAPFGSLDASPQPADKLPVAADPAPPPGDIGAIARRKIFIQFGVAEQPGAGVATFQKIVAQDAVGRKASFECPLERIDVVDALADERALVEDVLVYVRNGARVLVDARLAPVQARIARPVGAPAS